MEAFIWNILGKKLWNHQEQLCFVSPCEAEATVVSDQDDILTMGLQEMNGLTGMKSVAKRERIRNNEILSSSLISASF